MKENEKKILLQELAIRQPTNSELVLSSIKPKEDEYKNLNKFLDKVGLNNLMLNFGSSGLDGRYFGVGLRGKL
jgi:hypothetical protein